MKLQLPFGRGDYAIDVPDRHVRKVLKTQHRSVLSDPTDAVHQSLANPIDCEPLLDLARNRRDAVIVICDRTRPVPNQLLLEPMLDVLAKAGMPKDKITILVATGLHRPNTTEELVDMVGQRIVDEYEIVNHRAEVRDEQHLVAHTQRGTPVEIDKRYVDADLKISTGYIEPHLMAGFSGGRKVVAIGCGSEALIRHVHAPQFVEHPNSIEGVLDDNILHEELTEIVRHVGMDFIVNVTMAKHRSITAVFSGHFESAFATGCDYARKTVRDTVADPCDIVISSCGGFPQDCSYYQSAKGFTGARHIIKRGGTILLLSKCELGIGGDRFRELCRSIKSVDEFDSAFVNGPRREIDQWQINNTVRAMRHCECVLIDEGLTEEDRRVILPSTSDAFESAFSDALAKHGQDATVAIIPEGPNVLAQLD